MESLALKEDLGFDPQEDGGVFLGPKKKAANLIVDDIRQTVNAGRFPKKVILGVFGIGKTHFINYAMNKLSDVIYPILVETPPTHKRSRFTDLYSVFLRKVAKDQVLDILFESLKTKSKVLAGQPELRRVIEETKNDDSHKFVLWKFLSGSKLTGRELRELDFGHPQILEDEAVWVLNVLGDGIMRTHGKPLIIFFDEFENTFAVQGDSYSMFYEAIRGMVDEGARLGVVFVASGRQIGDYPTMIMEEPVKRRIGFNNFVNFTEYTKDDLLQFAQEAIVYRRKADSKIQEMIKDIKTTEQVSSQTYPFTREAILALVDLVDEMRKDGKIPSRRPGDLTGLMNACAQEFLSNKGSGVIDSAFIKNVLKKKTEYTTGEKGQGVSV